MKTRRTYTPIRIDFTPFVSIALLLIVFFVWVKMVQKPNVMALAVPNKVMCETVEIDGWNSIILTLYLIGNHKLLYAFGQPGQQSELKMTCFHGCYIGNFSAYLSKKYKDRFIIILKPTAESNFADMVDIVDEMHIAKIKRYALVDALAPSEQSSVANYSP